MPVIASTDKLLPKIKIFLFSKFRTNEQLLNRAVWIFYFIVCFSHIVSLPLFVAYDSQWYVHLADILGTNRFPDEWDFLRTPLFPLLLRCCFWLWGRDALTVFGLQACFTTAGVFLLSRRLRGSQLSLEAAIGVIVVGTFPTLIAYQHLLLTEIGSFFFLALIVFLLANPKPPSWKGAAYLALAIAIGYYHRSTFVYLSPLVAGIYVLRSSWVWPKGYLLRQALPMFLIVALVPYALAYPWSRNPKVPERLGQSILYGLVHQAVVPMNDPIMNGLQPIYARVVSESLTAGLLPNSGLTSPHEGDVVSPIQAYGAMGNRIFFRIATHNPVEYAKAVGRNLEVMTGFDLRLHDNAMYRQIILSSVTSEIDPGPSSFPPLGDEFRLTTSPNFTSQWLRWLAPGYDWLVRAGVLATMIGLLIGLWRLDRSILAFTAPPLAFLLIHAIVLLSQDRMVLAAQPIFIFNLILLPAWLREWLGEWLRGKMKFSPLSNRY